MCGERPEEAAVTATIRSCEHDDGDENNDRNADAFSIKAVLARGRRWRYVKLLLSSRTSFPARSTPFLLLEIKFEVELRG